jgi:hypothetical protein
MAKRFEGLELAIPMFEVVTNPVVEFVNWITFEVVFPESETC